MAFIISASLNAQGVIFNDDVYKKIPSIKVSKKKGKKIGDSFSLMDFTPTPGVQGKMATCVGWSIANAYTIQNAYKVNNRHKGSITANMFSPAFIYNNLIHNKNKDCKSGVLISDGLQFLKESGVCLKKTFDYNQGITCVDTPPNHAVQEALQNRLQTTFKRVFQNANEKITNTKYQLALGNPVIAGFNRIPLGRDLRGQHVWHPDRKSEPSGNMGHAMVVVAFDESTFTLMNSNGTSWGRDGFIKISYEDYKEYVEQAYVLDIKPINKSLPSTQSSKVEIPVEIKGKVHVSFSEENKAPYSDLSLSGYNKQERFYKVKNTQDIKKKFLRFEIDVPAGQNAYLFNADEQGNSVLLWEMGITSKDTTVILPANSFDTYFYDGETKEYLGVIFSYEEVPNFKTRIKRLKISEDVTISAALKKLWPNKMISDSIDYTSDTLSFQTKATYSQGVMVPIIIGLE